MAAPIPRGNATTITNSMSSSEPTMPCLIPARLASADVFDVTKSPARSRSTGAARSTTSAIRITRTARAMRSVANSRPCTR